MSDDHVSVLFGFDWQYKVLLWVQSFHTAWLDWLMKAFTVAGTEGFYLIVLPVLFWAVRRKMGIRLAYILLLSMYCNTWLKDWLQVLRPIGVPGVRSSYVASATGYSWPSGHAQAPVTFYVTLCEWLKRWWVWALSLVFAVILGVSRLYLGLHWPVDIFTGWALGLVFGVAGWWCGKWWTYRQYGFKLRLAVAILLPVVLMAFHTGSLSLQYGALLLGVSVGAVLDDRYFRFEMKKSIWLRICCVFIGIAGFLALQWMLRWLVIDPSVWSASRAVLAGLWGTLGAPFVFYRCGIYYRREVA